MLKLTGPGSRFLFEPLPQVSQAPRSFTPSQPLREPAEVRPVSRERRPRWGPAVVAVALGEGSWRSR